MKKQISIMPLVVVLFFSLLAFPCQLLADQYQVTHVIDGDTIKVDDGARKITVRLAGIDAPETPKGKNQTGQPFNQRSKKHLSSLVLNQVVDINSYGNVNQRLITLSASCAAMTMSSMLVVSPTCLRSRRLKWFRQVPHTRIFSPPFS
jgi:hypothetical protein